MKLTAELFVIPEDGDTHLVYAPLRRAVFRADGALLRMLAALQDGHVPDDALAHPALAALREAGVIDGQPEHPPQPPATTGYQPTRTTLFLTSRCNLGCRYCYGEANDAADMTMPEETGRAAIDFAARNCVARKEKQLAVGFHGGGEPTLAWRQLQAFVEHARGVAQSNGLALNTGISTNGCFGAVHARWIMENLSFVSVSADGPPALQDAQRPRRGGTRSSAAVRRTLALFDEAGYPYSIQSTFTNESVQLMPAVVRYYARCAKPRFLKFEPVSAAGRCAGRPDMVPGMRDFARHFNEAYEIACDAGINLIFSGIRLWGGAVSSFCGAFLEPFSVTPDGYVTACYEVCSGGSEYDNIFLIGRYDAARRDFEIDMERLARLRRRNIHRLEPCGNCFCKYSCGGDCATRNFRAEGRADLELVGARCEAIREITRYRLHKYLEQAAATAAVPSKEIKNP